MMKEKLQVLEKIDYDGAKTKEKLRWRPRLLGNL
jgi:hypothetical protein